MGKVDDLYLENLNEFVFDEKKIVNYKYLAVTLGVHVNISKQMLYTFYTREKQKGKKICATYFLSGFAAAGNFRNKTEAIEVDDDAGSGIHDEHFIILCGCHKLEETKSKFTKLLSVHVYAVSASPVEDFQELKSADNLTKNSSPHQKPMVYKANSADDDVSIKCSRSSLKRPLDNNVSQNSPQRKSMVKTESESPVDKKDSNKVAAPENDTNSPPRKKLFFNPTNKSDKQKNQKPSSKSSKSKPKGQQQKLSFKPDETEKYIIKAQELPLKRKSQTGNVKKEVVESDSEEEEDEQDIRERTPSPPPPPRTFSKRQPAKSQPRHRKSKVYIESDSDTDDDVEAASPPRRKSRIIESDSDDDDFVKVRSPLKQQQNHQQQEEQAVSVNGKKRVAKMISKTFMGEDGYLVTKNVRELVSEDEGEDHSVKMEVEEEEDTKATNGNIATKITATNGNITTKAKSQDVIPVKSSSETKKGKQSKSSSQSKGKQQSIMSFFKPKP